jgi:hypothetical protein
MKLLIYVKILSDTIFLKWGHGYFPTHSKWRCPTGTTAYLHHLHLHHFLLHHFLNPGRFRWGHVYEALPEFLTTSAIEYTANLQAVSIPTYATS